MSDSTRLTSAMAALASNQAVIGEEAAGTALAALRERLLALEQAARHPAAAPSAAALAGERRIVTVLYADVSGFTALAERADPETVRDSINACFDRLVPCVEQYGGTVDKFIGDAIMALFGAPTAHENDPERALRAALAMMAAMEGFNADYGSDLGLHMGINTGLVIAGGIGARGWQQYSVMGDAVNVAARLEDLADRGEIFVGPDTYRATAALFDFTARAPIALKGKAQPLPIYALRGLRAQPARVRGIAGLSAPLIGRTAELAALRALAAGLERGEGRAVYLIGEAGLGKSRLLAELRAELELRQPALGLEQAMPLWMESQAVAYQSARPYALFQQLFRQMGGLGAAATPAQVDATIDHMLARLTADGAASAYPARARRVFEVLLGLNDDPERLHMGGELFRRELFSVVSAMLRARLAAGPLVLALDDLHWADPASIELLDHLLPLAQRGPLLLICALRPERQSPAWQLMASDGPPAPLLGDLLEIAPLSSADSNALVDSLLSVANLPADLRERILQRADGNPFFVEEIVRDLIDRGVLVRNRDGSLWHAAADAQSAIPESLHALLATRIDRLTDAERRTLQLAAVIGRSFDQPLLAEVAEPGTRLGAHLEGLQAAGLIVRLDDGPAPGYRFRHALTQEAAYSSMLLRHRRAYHERIGAALERLYPQRVDELAPTLAQHFAEAGDAARAVGYYRRAGEGAARLYAQNDAIRYYRQALELARPQPADSRLLIQLYTQLGRALELSAQFGPALLLYEELAARGRAESAPQIELAGLLAAATIRATPTSVRDPAAGEALARAALGLARDLGDPAAEARALWNLQLAAGFVGRSAESIAYGQASLAIARAHGLREQLAYTLNDLGLTYLSTRGLAAAQAVLEEAHALWRELDNLPMLSDTLGNLALVGQLAGNLDTSRRAAEEGRRIAQSIGNLWGLSFSLSRLTQLDMEAGDFQAAIASSREAIRIGGQSGLPFAWTVAPMELGWAYAHLGMLEQGLAETRAASDVSDLSPQLQPWPLLMLARLLIRAGDLAAAVELIGRAGDLARASQFVSYTTFLLPLATAELAIRRHDYAAALAGLEPLIRHTRESGVRQFLIDMLYLAGAAGAALGQTDEARAHLREAVELTQATGARRLLWPALLAWGELEAAQGDLPRADELRRQAGATLIAIADRIEDSALRESFLSTPAARRAMGDPATPQPGLIFP